MVGVSLYTVAEHLGRAGVVGIIWPVPAALDDVALERKLFTPPFTSGPGRPLSGKQLTRGHPSKIDLSDEQITTLAAQKRRTSQSTKEAS